MLGVAGHKICEILISKVVLNRTFSFILLQFTVGGECALWLSMECIHATFETPHSQQLAWKIELKQSNDASVKISEALCNQIFFKMCLGLYSLAIQSLSLRIKT